MSSSSDPVNARPGSHGSKHEETVRLFLSGELPKKGLIDALQNDAAFRTYVGALANTEDRLAILLAQERFSKADSIEPPAWAIERLRGAAHKLKAGARFSRWMPAGFVWRFAVGAALLLVFSQIVTRSIDYFKKPEGPAVSSIMELPIQTFLAQAGPPQIIRGTTPLIYSPSGLTKQPDPLLLIRSDLKTKDLKVQVSVIGEPPDRVSEGFVGDRPQRLSRLLTTMPSLAPNSLVKLKLVADQVVLAEETFKVSEQPDLIDKGSSADLLNAASRAIKDTPPRPGDALTCISRLPKYRQDSELAKRIRYLAYLQLGDVQKAEEVKAHLQER